MMIRSHKLSLAVLLALSSATPMLAAQQLRRGIESAEVLVVATCVRVQPTKSFVLHRLKILEVLRGKEILKSADGKPTRHATVIEIKRVTQHARPAPAQLRLYCLHHQSKAADKLKELPDSFGPYFKMSGFPGSNPNLQKDLAKDPHMGLVRVLLASEKGAAPRTTATRLFQLALKGNPRVRIEAAQLLAERELLLGYLNRLQMSEVLTRAIGETEDIPYKVALSDLCATKRMDRLVNSLAIAVSQTEDRRYLRAIGRIAKYLHQESAVNVLVPLINRAKGKARERLIYALGATSTEGALTQLLRMQNSRKDSGAVEAALRVHGSDRALKAIKRVGKVPPPAKKK